MTIETKVTVTFNDEEKRILSRAWEIVQELMESTPESKLYTIAEQLTYTFEELADLTPIR